MWLELCEWENNGRKYNWKERGKPHIMLLTDFGTVKNRNPEKAAKELCNLINILQGIKCFVGPKPISLEKLVLCHRGVCCIIMKISHKDIK